MLQLVALLTIICVTLLILAQNLAEHSTHTVTNTESAAAREQTSPRHAWSIARVASEIISRVTISRDQMEDARKELSARKRRVSSVCESIGSKKSYLDAALTNMIIDM